MPSAKQKAIGTPITSRPATISPRKIGRFQLPSPASAGRASHSPATSAAMTATDPAMARQSRVRITDSTISSVISPIPAGSAAARTDIGSPSAGEVTKDSS